MEIGNSGSSEHNNKHDEVSLDIFCDHQSDDGKCCNRHAAYRLDYKDSEYAVFVCKSCIYDYMEEADITII